MTTYERLDGLIGLGHSKSLVSRLAAGGSEVHAVLLYGPEGAGKGVLASILAQAWLCTAPTGAGACGACAACQSAVRAAHPDLLLVEPLPPSHIIRLAAVTGGEDALSIQHFFRTPPLSGRNKVVVVDSAERMNADAANAFLKTLEEPPDRARIVLTSASPGSLLPTILSRCIACACELPADAELAARFPGADEFLRRLGGGAPGRVFRLLESPTGSTALQELAEAVSSMKPRDALAVTERFRAVAEARDSAGGARRAQASTLAELGVALKVLGRHTALTDIAEAHRRIIGNGSSTLVLDQLFTRLSSTSGGGN